jgi:hypothetical protein
VPVRRHKFNPDDFPRLVCKLMELDTTPYAWSEEGIPCDCCAEPIVLGDGAGICPEHAVGLLELRGGGVMGDLPPLAVLAGTSHVVARGFGLPDRAGWLQAMIGPFLDPPAPEAA